MTDESCKQQPLPPAYAEEHAPETKPRLLSYAEMSRRIEEAESKEARRVADCILKEIAHTQERAVQARAKPPFWIGQPSELYQNKAALILVRAELEILGLRLMKQTREVTYANGKKSAELWSCIIPTDF